MSLTGSHRQQELAQDVQTVANKYYALMGGEGDNGLYEVMVKAIELYAQDVYEDNGSRVQTYDYMHGLLQEINEDLFDKVTTSSAAS